ncbi:hypothetical protein [Streptomyces sp. NPDC089919]|uniref:hypothetical protein n=1 Tax=Streptomyces sp. NPDC089919 TaxID=3155188 RepID=UPI003422E794
MSEETPPSWAKACATAFFGLSALVVTIALLSSSADDKPSSPTREQVAAADFAKWPFTVPDGELRCRDGLLVTFATSGFEYGINGMAQDRGYPRPDAIWAYSPSLGHGLKVSIDEVLKRGLRLCRTT